MKKLKISVITQSDIFCIPLNVKLLGISDYVEIKSIVEINNSGSLVNKKSYFIRGFGLLQCMKLFVLSLPKRILIVLEKITFYKYNKSLTLLSNAKFFNCDYKVTNSVNSKEFVNYLKCLNLDLIISYSAPIVFKNDLLSLPRLGCINLHCSLLPAFAGLFPSFWSLFESSKSFGASVHYMDDKIDNGDVIEQVKIKPPSDSSIFQLICLTKLEGGKLMLDVVSEIAQGINILPLNLPKPDFHYSWPSICQMKEFRRKGGCLV